MAWTISNAMMKAYENSRSSQELAVEFSEATCSDGEQSAQLSTTPTPDQFYWPDKTTEHSRLSRFGMTCVPLTESLGADLLTWFRAGFPARTLAQPVRAQDSTVSEADSGAKWQGSFAKFDHDTSSWKTAQCSLLGDSESYLETWPRWGSMRNGASFLRPIPTLHTFGKESGLWPTPNASQISNNLAVTCSGDGREKPNKLGWAVAEATWPTPRSCSAMASTITPQTSWNPKRNPNLETIVGQRQWPTPTANMHTGAGSSGRLGGLNLQTAVVRTWPTPCASASASASKGSSTAALTRKSGKSRANDRIDHAVMASDGGQLNPEWVEWLMGWPIGQTDLKPLATAKFQEWLQQHGEF